MKNPQQMPGLIQKMTYIGIAAVCLVMAGALLIGPARRNLAFAEALRASLHQPANYDQAAQSLEPLAKEDCRVYWQVVMLGSAGGNSANLDDPMGELLACTPRSIDWLLLVAPERSDLALQATQLYPQEPKAWFWLGDLAKASGDQLEAKQYFTESVRLDKAYALAWCRLGLINENEGLIADAEEAYLQCCQNGDPGSNGCYGAGRMAEKLDDIPNAIRYYRRSHWLPALERADMLEASR